MRASALALGRLERARSTWRTLSASETATYGGSDRRHLYGCR